MDDARLREVYYNPARVGSLGGIKALAKATGTSLSDTKRWLSNEFAYSLHKESRKWYTTGPYRTSGTNRQWQSDLDEMIEYENENDGYRYIMTVIDLFSRYAWA